MKRMLLLLCACFVAIAGFGALAAQDRAPRIVFESQSMDFGKVTEGETLRHVFKFKNEGGAPLRILKVQPS